MKVCEEVSHVSFMPLPTRDLHISLIILHVAS